MAHMHEVTKRFQAIRPFLHGKHEDTSPRWFEAGERVQVTEQRVPQLENGVFFTADDGTNFEVEESVFLESTTPI